MEAHTKRRLFIVTILKIGQRNYICQCKEIDSTLVLVFFKVEKFY